MTMVTSTSGPDIFHCRDCIHIWKNIEVFQVYFTDIYTPLENLQQLQLQLMKGCLSEINLPIICHIVKKFVLQLF